MKKLFTIDDFMVAFIAALGYGFGETIATLSGWPGFMCVVASFALGIAFEEIIYRIVFSKAVQKSTRNRVLTFAAILLFFLLAQFISIRWMGVSMIDYLTEEFMYVVGLPILGLLVNLLIRKYRIQKIRERYGDGSDGYVFDLKEEDIAETNKRNHPIQGEYDKSLAVKTRTGIYVGEKNKKVISYLGIPYAMPPVGKLRWKAPEALPSSDAVYEATNFGASAIQVEHSGAILKNHRQSEDCLYLNVYVGSEKSEEKKPVAVLFHHGDFTYGGSADPLLYGENFVSGLPDIIIVTFNYRLGIFGFIDFSEVPGGEAYPDALNLGLLDQIAALKWIKENISAFGGDPERITVIGYESGATSICMLAACEKAKGLFTRAFAFNGNPETVYDTSEGARRLVRNLLKETKTAAMDELLRLSTDSLKNAAQKLWKDMCAPTYDGTLFPANLYQAFREGKAAGIDFIIGIPGNESNVFRAFIGNQKFEKLMAEATADVQNGLEAYFAAAVREYIAAQSASSSELEAKSRLIDQWIAISLYRIALKLSEGGNNVHLMCWDQTALIEKLGSGTVDMMATQLGNSEALQIYGSVIDDELSEVLQAFFHKFIYGEALKLYPNEIKGIDALNWKPFPEALIISDGSILCEKIEDRLTEIDGLLNLVKK